MGVAPAQEKTSSCYPEELYPISQRRWDVLQSEASSLAPPERELAIIEAVTTGLKSIGARCDLITIKDGAHGMGSWDKLGSDYKEQMIAWLKKTLREKP